MTPAELLLRRWQQRDNRYAVRCLKRKLTDREVESVVVWRRQEWKDVGSPPMLIGYLLNWPAQSMVA